VRFTEGRKPEQIARLESAVSAARSKSPSVKSVMDRYKLSESRRPLDDLDAIERWLDHDVGTVVEVIGQGVGRVVDVNLELDTIKVDIGGKKPVSVPFGAVHRFLRALPEGDFLRLKVEDPEGLTSTVTDAPGDALVHLLESLPEAADVATIKAAMTDLLPMSSWNSWWTKARKHPRVLSSGTGSRLRYTVSESADDVTDSLMNELRAASPRDRLKTYRRVADRGDQAALGVADLLLASLPKLAKKPGLAWETAAAAVDLPGGRDEAETELQRLLAEANPVALLNGIRDRGTRHAALQRIRESHADDWHRIWSEWLLHEETASLLTEIAAELEAAGHHDLVDASVEAIFRNHLKHPAQFVWAAESMLEDHACQALRARVRPSLLEKIPDTLSRREFSAYRARAKNLLEGGQIAVELILKHATPVQGQRFVDRVNRIDAVDPGQARLVNQAVQQVQGKAGTIEDDGPLLVATKGAIEGKQAELRQLVEIDIPKTLKGINAAAAEGDLRENFEYHMLRDRQELQSAQAAKLQADLGIVRVLEPGVADTSVVNIGTVVHFDADDVAPVTILGSWDADISQRIFANGTELAQGLLGHSIGDEVNVDGATARIAAIEAWQG
jgi:transcription elongation factor GreA